MPRYKVSWVDRVLREVVVDAPNEEQAEACVVQMLIEGPDVGYKTTDLEDEKDSWVVEPAGEITNA